MKYVDFAFVPGADGTKILLPETFVASRYFYWYLRTYRLESRGYARHYGRLIEQRIALPPLAEQKRIVARVDQLMALIDDLEQKQIRKRQFGANFTKASLEALTTAETPEDFDGAWKRVVENWGVAIDRAEKVAEIREALAALAVQGRLVPQMPGDLPIAVGVNELDGVAPLPVSWRWATPDELASPRRNALAIGPFGSDLLKADYRESGVPLVFVREITSRSFGGSKTKFVSSEKAAQLAAHQVRPGDLLMTKMGTPPGDTAIYPSDREPAIVTADCIKMSPHPAYALAEYLQIAIAAKSTRSKILEITMGIAHQKVSLKRFRVVPLPVPPLAEQKRIVAKVDYLMKLCDELEAKLRRSEDRASKLVEAVVGEMVG